MLCPEKAPPAQCGVGDNTECRQAPTRPWVRSRDLLTNKSLGARDQHRNKGTAQPPAGLPYPTIPTDPSCRKADG